LAASTSYAQNKKSRRRCYKAFRQRSQPSLRRSRRRWHLRLLRFVGGQASRALAQQSSRAPEPAAGPDGRQPIALIEAK
jgi:hypothetical protein